MIHFGTITFDWNTFTDSGVSEWRCSLKNFDGMAFFCIYFVNKELNTQGKCFVIYFGFFGFQTLTTIKLGFCRSPSTANGIQFFSNFEQKYQMGWDRSVPRVKNWELGTKNKIETNHHIHYHIYRCKTLAKPHDIHVTWMAKSDATMTKLKSYSMGWKLISFSFLNLFWMEKLIKNPINRTKHTIHQKCIVLPPQHIRTHIWFIESASSQNWINKRGKNVLKQQVQEVRKKYPQ